MDDEILITQADWQDCYDPLGQTMVSGLQRLARGTSCGSWSGTPNLDIVGKKFVGKKKKDICSES